METERTYVNIIKAIYYKLKAHIILNRKKTLKTFLLRSETRQGGPLWPLLFSVTLKVLATAVREKEEIKVFKEMEEVRPSLFADDKIMYIENPKD